MREVREFRVHYPTMRRAGVEVACVTRESPAENRWWSKRLNVPFPMLSDREGEASRALHIARTVPIGPWKLDLFRRTTLLVDVHGSVVAVWGKVKVRGHALDVLDLARATGAA